MTTKLDYLIDHQEGQLSSLENDLSAVRERLHLLALRQMKAQLRVAYLKKVRQRLNYELRTGEPFPCGCPEKHNSPTHDVGYF